MFPLFWNTYVVYLENILLYYIYFPLSKPSLICFMLTYFFILHIKIIQRDKQLEMLKPEICKQREGELLLKGN